MKITPITQQVSQNIPKNGNPGTVPPWLQAQPK